MMEKIPNYVETIQEQHREKKRIQKRAERFAALKKEKGISFEKMEAEVGVSISTLKRFEKTSISIRDSSVKKVAQYLGVRFEYLAGYDDDKTEEEHLRAIEHEEAKKAAREYVRLHRPYQIAREQRDLITRVLAKADIECVPITPKSMLEKYEIGIPEYCWITGATSKRNEWRDIKLTFTDYDYADDPNEGEKYTYQNVICSEEEFEAILDDIIDYADNKISDFVYERVGKLLLYRKMKDFAWDFYKGNEDEKGRFMKLEESFYIMAEAQMQKPQEDSTDDG